MAEVAPYVGAWIETSLKQDPYQSNAVAPYVGAWIETGGTCARCHSWQSHPTWVRGLKQTNTGNTLCRLQSHPTWVRGLKQIKDLVSYLVILSHPTWVRGLKRTCNLYYQHHAPVAPYVGAWIETSLMVIVV